MHENPTEALTKTTHSQAVAMSACAPTNKCRSAFGADLHLFLNLVQMATAGEWVVFVEEPAAVGRK